MMSQYGAYDLHAGLVRLHARKRTPAAVHPPTYTYACIRTHPLARAHTQICNTFLFSTATVVTRTRLIVTLYVHFLTCFPCEYMAKQSTPGPWLTGEESTVLC